MGQRSALRYGHCGPTSLDRKLYCSRRGRSVLFVAQDPKNKIFIDEALEQRFQNFCSFPLPPTKKMFHELDATLYSNKFKYTDLT
jgi:hypothetical protein